MYQTKEKSCKFGKTSMYLIIKFDKNLFNFVCRAVAAVVSARQGHHEKTRGYDDQSKNLGSQGPLSLRGDHEAQFV